MAHIALTNTIEEQIVNLTGITKSKFYEILNALKSDLLNRKSHRGRKKKLNLEHCLLMTLEFLKSGKTYCHISEKYGISTSAGYVTIRWVKKTLMKYPEFSL
ncbi:MAG: hypothetical protein AB8B61_00550 [Cyclobacteriaceae bacterium]